VGFSLNNQYYYIREVESPLAETALMIVIRRRFSALRQHHYNLLVIRYKVLKGYDNKA
jgi:hypothetical protein